MMVKKNKTLLTMLTALLSFVVLAVVLTSVVIGSVYAVLLYDETQSFEYTDANNNTFTCFPITATGRENPYELSIAWGENPEDTPDDLVVPEKITHGGHEYTVIAVATYGFRYCDFHTIDLPKTIEEIREGAFAYCDKMTTFSLPYPVKTISASAFLDCRAMTDFFYQNQDKTQTTLRSNTTVERIEDHAFNACASLTDFNCPSKLTYFGQSSFQKCASLQNLFFPASNGQSGDNLNKITIEPYAFADCDKLKYIYWEQDNMHSISEYAFIDCSSELVIHIGATSYIGDPATYAKFTTNWAKQKIAPSVADLIPIEADHKIFSQSSKYQGLRYTIETDIIRLESTKKTLDNRKALYAPASNEKYIKIIDWTAPSNLNDPTYYVSSSGTLIIPDEIEHSDGNTYKVRVIEAPAFQNKGATLKDVTFNKSLVQIGNRAFRGSNQIAHLRFEACTDLKEISYEAFGAQSYSANAAATELNLPNCLEYIGIAAFYNFTKVNSLTFKANNNNADSNLKYISQYAFANLGSSVGANDRNIHLKLPKSLRDQEAAAIDPKTSGNGDNPKYSQYCLTTNTWVSIGDYCFINALAIITVEMEKDDAHKTDMNYTTSFAPNAFRTAKNMIWFKGNTNLCYLGADLFKECESIIEIFLSSVKSCNVATQANHTLPWGTKNAGSTFDESLFSGENTNVSELVIYVDGEVPGDYDNLEEWEGKNTYPHHTWNSEWNKNAYAHGIYYDKEADTSRHYLNRSTIPTITNIDWQNEEASGLVYWNPKTKAVTTAPTKKADYQEGSNTGGRITLVKEVNTSNYTVGRYFASGGVDTVDLTEAEADLPSGSHITVIGPEAFGKITNAHLGLYFVLPTTVHTISERAFFRSYNGQRTKIVTYKNGANYVTTSGTAASLPTSGDGYCCLPSAVTKIERDAFYNNNFKKIILAGAITFFGKGAFYSHENPVNESITFGTGSIFSVNATNGGVYYDNPSDTAHKMLIYQPQAHKVSSPALATDSELEIESGTKGLLMHSCAGTNYTQITLNAQLTTIYGGALANNLSLTTIVGGTGLQYIGAPVHGTDTEVYDEATLGSMFDNIDYRKILIPADGSLRRELIESNGLCFRGNTNMTTINLKAMSSLKKIGHGAFLNCTNLKNMTGGETYTYYKYSGGTFTLQNGGAINEGVLDLSTNSNLISIGRNSFNGCSSIKYVHLPSKGQPRTLDDNTIYVGKDPDFNWHNNETNGIRFLNDNLGAAILVGNTSATSNTRAHSKNNDMKLHFNYANDSTNWYKGNTPYYFAESVSDLEKSGNTEDVHYWTQNGSYYILFDAESHAEAYFNAGSPSPVTP